MSQNSLVANLHSCIISSNSNALAKNFTLWQNVAVFISVILGNSVWLYGEFILLSISTCAKYEEI